jgi:transposase-like protein
LGVQLVDTLEGSAEAKERLKVVLETLSGTKTMSEACTELGVGETALRELRGQMLQAMVQELEPRARGRPKQEARPSAQDLAALQAENRQLQMQLRGLQIRDEIAVAMPHLLKDRAPEVRGPGEPGDAALKKTKPDAPRPPTGSAPPPPG